MLFKGALGLTALATAAQAGGIMKMVEHGIEAVIVSPLVAESAPEDGVRRPRMVARL